MSKVKHILRWTLAVVAMLVTYFVSTMIVGETSTPMTAEEMNQAGMALILVSVINGLVLSYLIWRSRWYGLKLIVTVIVVHFGVETFMTQIESLYFNSALQIGTAEFLSLVAAGATRALIFAPVAVLLFGKLKRPVQPEETGKQTTWPERGKRFAAVSLLYIFVYFLFGYFVAWQWEETRLFYTGTTAIKPFLTHFRDFFAEDPIILLFQLLRGALWTLLAVVILRMITARRWEAALAVALTFTAFLAIPLGLFPNPYMPPLVRQAHFYELLTSMLLFGGLAGWIMYSREA